MDRKAIIIQGPLLGNMAKAKIISKIIEGLKRLLLRLSNSFQIDKLFKGLFTNPR